MQTDTQTDLQHADTHVFCSTRKAGGDWAANDAGNWKALSEIAMFSLYTLSLKWQCTAGFLPTAGRQRQQNCREFEIHFSMFVSFQFLFFLLLKAQ
jgi:hypothetical protein